VLAIGFEPTVPHYKMACVCQYITPQACSHSVTIITYSPSSTCLALTLLRPIYAILYLKYGYGLEHIPIKKNKKNQFQKKQNYSYSNLGNEDSLFKAWFYLSRRPEVSDIFGYNLCYLPFQIPLLQFSPSAISLYQLFLTVILASKPTNNNTNNKTNNHNCMYFKLNKKRFILCKDIKKNWNNQTF